MVYALAPKGLRLLQELDDSGESWPSGGTGRAYLEHSLLVSDVLVALELSARRHRADVLSAEDILARAPRAETEGSRRDGWRIRIRHARRQYRLGVYPDAMFAVPGVRDHSLLFLEADRGTEAVRRKDLPRYSSMYNKFLLYWRSARLWRDPKTTPPYGFR